MKLKFDELKTPSSFIQVALDGENFKKYDVENVKADGITFSQDECPDLTKIKVKGQFKTLDSIDTMVYLDGDVGLSFPQRKLVEGEVTENWLFYVIKEEGGEDPEISADSMNQFLEGSYYDYTFMPFKLLDNGEIEEAAYSLENERVDGEDSYHPIIIEDSIRDPDTPYTCTFSNMSKRAYDAQETGFITLVANGMTFKYEAIPCSIYGKQILTTTLNKQYHANCFEAVKTLKDVRTITSDEVTVDSSNILHVADGIAIKSINLDDYAYTSFDWKQLPECSVDLISVDEEKDRFEGESSSGNSTYYNYGNYKYYEKRGTADQPYETDILSRFNSYGLFYTGNLALLKEACESTPTYTNDENLYVPTRTTFVPKPLHEVLHLRLEDNQYNPKFRYNTELPDTGEDYLLVYYIYDGCLGRELKYYSYQRTYKRPVPLKEKYVSDSKVTSAKLYAWAAKDKDGNITHITYTHSEVLFDEAEVRAQGYSMDTVVSPVDGINYTVNRANRNEYRIRNYPAYVDGKNTISCESNINPDYTPTNYGHTYSIVIYYRYPAGDVDGLDREINRR